MIRRVRREEMTDLFTTLREAYDAAWPNIRSAIVVCYALGFGLLLVVFCQNVASVAHVLLR